MNPNLSFLRNSRHRGRGLKTVLGTVATATLAMAPLAPAHASAEDGSPVGQALTGTHTEVVYTGHGAGLSVDGFLPPEAEVPDPLAAYPAGRPGGYVDEPDFAGVRNIASVEDPSRTGQTYCINLRVLTAAGTGYASGTWTESNVPNLGYVTYILHNYYPAVDAPSGLTDDQQAAAVQSAIWYFTDGFVLGATPAKVRAATAAIVADAQANGPVTEPPAPDVEITPASGSAAEGSAAGPYVVTAEGAAAVTVSVPTGYTMYRDAAATTPLANSETVPSGTSIWITGPGVTGIDTVLTARATVTVRAGTVYLYDGNSPGREDAQRLILGKTTQLEALATATAEYFAAGDLTVSKEYAGSAKGQQGAARLVIDCGEGYVFTQDIPAGTSTRQTYSFTGIPVGNTCTVTEPTTGATTEVGVTTDAPQTGTMTDEGLELTVTNTVELNPGSLHLVKAVTGGAAGSQDEISVRLMCVSGLEETFVIPAGSAAGEYEQSYTGLPAGDECTVTEPATGSNAVVEVTTDAPVTVTIAPGAAVEARVTNTVELRPGSLNVVKVIEGAGAGQQSAISLWVTCDNGLAEAFEIPAGASAGEYARTFGNLPAGTECTVAERETGANSSVDVAADDPVTVTIAPGAATDARLTNTVQPVQHAAGGAGSTTGGDALAKTGGDAPTPLLALAAGAIGLGALLMVAVRANRRNAE